MKVLILLVIISMTKAIIFDCEFKVENFKDGSSKYSCVITSIKEEHNETTITFNGNKIKCVSLELIDELEQLSYHDFENNRTASKKFKMHKRSLNGNCTCCENILKYDEKVKFQFEQKYFILVALILFLMLLVAVLYVFMGCVYQGLGKKIKINKNYSHCENVRLLSE